MTFEEWYASHASLASDLPGIAKAAWLASRKAALEEAAKLCLDRSEWIKGRQDGPPEELSNTIIRHHASASFADSDAILALRKRVGELEEELAGWQRTMDEALNTGDGSYRP